MREEILKALSLDDNRAQKWRVREKRKRFERECRNLDQRNEILFLMIISVRIILDRKSIDDEQCRRASNNSFGIFMYIIFM